MLMKLLNKKVFRLMLTAKRCKRQTRTVKGEEKSMKNFIGGQRIENCYNYIIISKIKKEKG